MGVYSSLGGQWNSESNFPNPMLMQKNTAPAMEILGDSPGPTILLLKQSRNEGLLHLDVALTQELSISTHISGNYKHLHNLVPRKERGPHHSRGNIREEQ